MTAVLLIGVGKAPGKSALAVGLGKRLQQEGRRVGYFKPRFGESAETPDADAAFVRGALQLLEAPDQLAPHTDPSPGLQDGSAAQERLLTAFQAVAAGKDIVLVEMPGVVGEPMTDSAIALVAEALDAKIIAVVGYWQDMDGAAVAAKLNRLKTRTVGVVVNSIPRTLLPVLRPALGVALAKSGFTALGFIPEDRRLCGFSIGEIATHLGATFLIGQDKAGGIIENLLLQANPADPLSVYVHHKPNRLVIVRTDRPDLQLATMDTEPRCLLLTGDGLPMQSILNRAEDEGIPLLRVALTTIETVAALDGLFESVRFRHAEKSPRMVELATDHLDMTVLFAELLRTED